MTDPPRLSSLLIKPAGPDCNLACAYCFYRPAGALYPHTRRPRMPAHVLRELVAQYMALSDHPAFCWQGGEPTLMGVDFFRTVIALQKKHGQSGQVVANSLQTNGILVDDEWARLLGRYSFLVGLSLDGPADIHDRYRRHRGGAPTHAQVLRALRTLRQHRVETNALSLVTPLAACQPERVFGFLVEQGLEYLQFIPCVEEAVFGLHPEQWGDFLCATFDLWLPLREQVHVRHIDDLLLKLLGRGQETSCCWQPECGDYLVVEHNGDVYACDFFVDEAHKFGNLLATPLAELALTPEALAFARGKRNLAPECLACEFLELCYGGCCKHRVFGAGRLDAPTHLCAGFRRFFAHAVPKLRPVVEEYRGRQADGSRGQ
jgi:uncharacterized protein